MTESANLIAGETVTIVERCYMTRTAGETVLYGVRLASGGFVAAAKIASIS